MNGAIPDPAERRWRALSGCERILSGVRPMSARERLSALLGSGYDLDGRHDLYGDGPVWDLEQRVAELLGKSDAAFFPTGTMAQQVALRCWAVRSGSRAVAMHPLHHPAVHERQAFSVLSGLTPVWLTREARQPTAADVRELDEPFGVLLVELPLRDAGFLLPGFAELTAVCQAARERGAAVHFDGARLWESTVHFGASLAEVAALADSVYVSFYKTLAGLSGAIVAGSDEFVAQAKAWRHRYGGHVFQQWPAIYSAMIGLDTILPELPSYVAHARDIAAALPGRVYPEPPHTHQFQLWLPYRAEVLNEANLLLAERDGIWFAGGWRDHPGTGHAMTEVTIAAPALAWTPLDAAAVMDRFLALARDGT